MITPEQLTARRLGVGSSDVPAIFGVSPFRTARDVWLEKRGIALPFAGNAATAHGNRFEGVILDWFEGEIAALSFARNVSLVGEEPWMLANLDALAIMPEGRKHVVEAKCVGMNGPHASQAEWGDEGSDEVPPYILLQCQWQMWVSGAVGAEVPMMTIVGGRLTFRRYFVRRDEGLINEILTGARDFWAMVQEGVEPEGAISPDVAKNIVRVPSTKPVPIPEELIRKYQQSREDLRAMEECHELLKGQIIAALGQGDWGACQAGKVTYKSAERRGFDSRAFAQDHPALAAKYEKITTYRTLRVPDAK